MNDFEFPLSPNQLHKHTGLYRRQEDLRLQQFRHSFNDGVFVDWPNNPAYRVAPAIHAKAETAYLVVGQRAGDSERGTPGVFVRSDGHEALGLRPGHLAKRR